MRYRSTNDLFHSWLRVIGPSYQIGRRHLLERRAGVNSQNLLLPVAAHHGGLILTVRGLAQIMLQLCTCQVWISDCVRCALRHIELTSRGCALLKLLHVIIGLHLVSIVVIVLSRVSPLLFLGNPELGWSNVLVHLLVLIVEPRINSDLIVKNWFVFSVLSCHLLLLVPMFSYLDRSLADVGLGHDRPGFLRLEDHTIWVLVRLIVLDRVLHRLGQLGRILARILLVVWTWKEILHLLDILSIISSFLEEPLVCCLVETALIA